MKSIAMIELRSIARGIETVDIMIKASSIKVLRATTICPGKYLIILTGDTASVKEALEVGLNFATPYVVNHSVIPNINPEVIAAIEGCPDIKVGHALGVLEYYAVVDSIVGADIATKTSNVSIIEIRMGFAIGGKGFVILTGDVSEVQYAINTAKENALESGMLLETCIIANASPELLDFLI